MQNKTNSNGIKSIILIPIYLIKYALLGIKVVCFDFWVYLYNALSWQVDSAYRKTKETLSTDELYERTKGSNKKKEKKYTYSNATLKKLEQEKAILLDDLKNAGATRSKEPHIYFFKVRESSGKITTGYVKGMSKLDVNSFLLNEGYDVYTIETSKTIEYFHRDTGVNGIKLSNKDLIFWITQLSTYLKAGLTLNNSVKILSQQMKGRRDQQRAFQSISYELTLGESFSNALQKQGNMFPPLMINMIKAAEASGTLTETLDDLSAYYTEIDDTKKQMISAVSYPIVILTFSIIVITFIFVYVVPQFEGIYASSNAPITGLTAVLISFSKFLKSNLLNILLVITIINLIIIIAYKKIKAFRASTQVFLMHLPLISKLIIYNELTIFAKTFASLLRNNVFITDSMDILSKITNNEVYKAILYKTINNIVKGEKISSAFENHWAVPDVAYYMIVTGESTGQLAEMMQKVSDYYQAQHRSIVGNLKTFIEPVLITLLAVIVGMIIIAVIVPMFEIYNTIK